VAFIDDVVATGGSLAAALRLLRLAGAEVVGVATCLAEGSGWRHTLGADADLVRSLGRIPVFHPDGSGGLKEDWDG
jgi:adenine phosphoribosyltransferase